MKYCKFFLIFILKCLQLSKKRILKLIIVFFCLLLLLYYCDSLVIRILLKFVYNHLENLFCMFSSVKTMYEKISFVCDKFYTCKNIICSDIDDFVMIDLKFL